MRNVPLGVIARFVAWCAGGRLLGNMSNNVDILFQLREEWRFEAHRHESQGALTGLRSRHPDLALDGLTDLGDVVRALEVKGGRSVVERARIVQGLLEDARDPFIHRALLQTMVPGIVSVCRQLRFGEGIVDDPSDVVSVALGLASELMVDWAGQSRPFAAPDLLSALKGRLRRWLLKEKSALVALSNYELRDDPATEQSPLLTRLQSLRGGPYERLARLTYLRVFEGLTLKEVAASDHSAPVTLQKELQSFAVRFLL